MNSPLRRRSRGYQWLGFDLLHSQPNLVHMELIHTNGQIFREQGEGVEYFAYNQDFQRVEWIRELAED